ncbi:MAG: bifunctional serine/threonine-protein kinase/formylglycine-generating enzyme family protein [Bacteroidales bacterium]|nr:bifunctional serine/threonine-protein kinase/formylglycine-generating enzyme family protein [Bacteroidales bacterium]
MHINEEYTLLQQLGQGGFATVYKARHNQLGYVRAIRMLNAFVPDEESEVYRKFLRECKVLLRLGNGNHPNIVHVYQPRLVDGHALVEMDYVEGVDLTHFIKQQGGFIPLEEVLRMVEEISSALAYCHHHIYHYCMDRKEDGLKTDPDDGSKVLIDSRTEQRLVEKYKVIHNDIHSGNIMRRIDGHYILLDFGLAIEGSDVIHSSRHENGAPEYKAPEKWDSDTIINEQTDIYGFGVVMYEYLSGRVPFPYDKALSDTKANYIISEAHKNVPPLPIRPLRENAFRDKHPDSLYTENYPAWLETIILRCLEKDPSRRFHNGLELHQAIFNGLKSHSDTRQDNSSNYQTYSTQESQQFVSSREPNYSAQEKYANQSEAHQDQYRPHQDDIYAEAKARSDQQSHSSYRPYQDDLYAEAKARSDQQSHSSYRPYQDDLYAEAKARSDQQSHSSYRPYQDDLYAEAKARSDQQSHSSYRPYQDDLYAEAKARSDQQSHSSYRPYQDDLYAEAKPRSNQQANPNYQTNTPNPNTSKKLKSKHLMLFIVLLIVAVVCIFTCKSHNEDVFKVNGAKFKMVYVDDLDLYIGETEVTQALWTAVMGKKVDTWCEKYGLGDDYPAYNVSYDDVQQFLKKLNGLKLTKGEIFRLPIVDEWVYVACGGGGNCQYDYCGSNSIDAVAWYKENSDKTTHPVKSKKCNELGIYDMSGNVNEWCSDEYYEIGDDVERHEYRGGSAYAPAYSCRVISNNHGSNTYSNKALGFRLVMEP